jgi:hypothetical protein
MSTITSLQPTADEVIYQATVMPTLKRNLVTTKGGKPTTEMFYLFFRRKARYQDI